MTLVVDKVLEDQLAQGVNALVQTVAYNVKLVRGIDSEIKDLTSDIETFSARLIEASKNSWANDHQVLRVVVKKFRNVVNEAQDTIADYVALKGKHVDNVFSKSLDKIPFCGKINDFAREIESIRGNLAKIRQDHGQELLHLMTYKINEQNKGLLTLQGPMTADKEIIEEAVNKMVRYVGYGSGEWSTGAPPGLYSKLKDVSFNIQMINARLQDQEAYTNPIASVDVLMLKTFQTIVNEATDAADKYWILKIHNEHKTLKKFLEPYRREVKSCASKIQSVESKVNMMIHQQQEINRRHSPTTDLNNVLLTLQIERPIGFDKAIKKVEQAVNILDQTVGDNVHLVSDKSEIEDITSQIKTFTESLVVACKSPLANENRVLRLIVKKFGTRVNEARDAVANYFAQEKKRGLAKAFDKIRFCGKLNNVASEIQSIKEKVKTICEDHKAYLQHLQEDCNKRSDHLPPPKVCTVLRENKIVGFIDDLKVIKTRLIEASKDFFVIPILGNAGTGKTTFALKLFEDPEVRKIFTHCIWVHVSRGFHRKQKFIDILHQIFKQTEDFSTKLEAVLEDKVKGLLKDERYLIVLDNVWEKED
ncbi:uncharacterized protein LOC116007230 isoform X2 [Ipomoea triloba]|uniref:uncharacterized protein LOC116007230 isoform X2 n=1 Tax=Ipomoea triloba TaxID=35885 RepID=UPI00125D39FF|nr:uncharacterized protein LOC116007230 isoform X2 [Ipomoea triloba]